MPGNGSPNVGWRDMLTAINKDPFLSSIVGMASVLRSRADVISKVGATFGGLRKHYEVFGWPIEPDYDYWWHMYKRGGIAKRIVVAYPQATWRTPPTVLEEKDDPTKETQFETAWMELVDKVKVFHYLERIHRMARLGRYSVLFMGFSDAKSYDDLAQPVGVVKPGGLLYLQPYAEDKASVNRWVEDPGDPRFGLPLDYQLQLDAPSFGKSRSSSRSVLVHHSRTLYVAEDVLESDLEGYPALEPVINLLLDIEKVLGSAAEAFFQQSPPATVFNTPADAMMDASVLSDTDMQTKVDDFVHGFKRWLVTKGMEVSTLSPALGDPSNVYNPLLELVAGTTGIPKRILVGSERGELASSQDETNWNKRVEECQTNWAEPFLLRPFIDTLVAKGVLPAPAANGKYLVQWKDNMALGQEAMADIGSKRADSLAKYASAMGADEIVPPDVFLEEILGLPQEVVDRIKETREELWEMDLEEMLNPPELDESGMPIPEGGEVLPEDELLEEEPAFKVHKGGKGGASAKRTRGGGAAGRFRESDHPRARGGKFAGKPGGGKAPSAKAQPGTRAAGPKAKGELSEKAQRAKDAHVKATKEVQRNAIANEKDLAKRIGAKHMPDNEPFDVHASNGKNLIECKTIQLGKHNKITMSKAALGRKVKMASKTGAKPHTVVFDDRTGHVYYAKGVGSFRIGSMEKIGTKKTYGTRLKAKLKGQG